jgi:nucleoid DNA-binding protein
MKKSEFVAAVAKEAGITRVQADKVVNAALSVISSDQLYAERRRQGYADGLRYF